MIIKYCEKCSGRPYTTNLQINNCPKCGSVLGIESVDDIEVEDRTQLYIPKEEKHNEEISQHRSHYEKDNDDNANTDYSKKLPVKKSKRQELATPFAKFQSDNSQKDNYSPDNCIRGKVAQYSSSGTEDGEYRRFLPQKIYQAIVYRQRLEDVLHRFTVRVDRGEDSLGYQQYNDIPVNVHGTIAGGLQIIDNAEVQVSGKYRDGVLMADEIYIINNGYKSKVSFQRSVRAIVYGVLSAIMFLFVCFVAATSDGNFFANIKEFCTVWFVITAILTVLYLITRLTPIGILSRMYSKKKPTFPIFVIILISLALAFLFVSAFGSFTGFGSYLSGWIYSIVPIVIIVIALFFVIKSIF